MAEQIASSVSYAPIDTGVSYLRGDEVALVVEQAARAVLVEPIMLARAKSHLRVVLSDEDDDIAGMIVAARQIAEGRLNRTLVQRQMVATFAPGATLTLLKPPLVGVDSVEYFDTDDNLLTLSNFHVYPGTPAQVGIPYGAAPSTLADRPDAVRVTYTAGYTDGDIPAPIISWMLLVIGTLYDNRATMAAGVQTYGIPDDFMSLLIQPYMVYE